MSTIIFYIDVKKGFFYLNFKKILFKTIIISYLIFIRTFVKQITAKTHGAEYDV